MSPSHRAINELLSNPLKAAISQIERDQQLSSYLVSIHNYYLGPVKPSIDAILSYEAKPDLIPRKDRWRFFIDGRRQDSACTPLSFDPGDPGYHSGIFSAFQLMLHTLHLPLDVELIVALHDMAIKEAPRRHFTGITSVPMQFGFVITERQKTITEQGLLALKDECNSATPLLSIGKFLKFRPNIVTPLSAEELSALTLDSFKENDYGRTDPDYLLNGDHLSDEEKITAKTKRLEKSINQYQQEILEAKGDSDLTLKAILRLAQQSELLHPFMDANIRTFGMLLVNRELLLHGFPPVLWEDPNRLDGYSINELLIEIKHGMEKARSYGFRAVSPEEIHQYCSPPRPAPAPLVAPPPLSKEADEYPTRPRSGSTPSIELPPDEYQTRPRSGTTPDAELPPQDTRNKFT